MDYSIVDMETDGLLDSVTKIHCLSVYQVRGSSFKTFTLYTHEDIVAFFESEKLIIGHNFILYDKPVIKKIIGYEITSKIIDSLALSWQLYPERNSHGLGAWGDDLGVQKPVIADWNNLTIEEYTNRCEVDAEINNRLFMLQWQYLLEIYGSEPLALRLCMYLAFKLECAAEQQELMWKIDRERCITNLQKFEEDMVRRLEKVAQVMPKQIEYKIYSRPKQMHKKDGSFSSRGEAWVELLRAQGLPDYHLGAVKLPHKELEPNPASFPQLKDWLFSLGWQPKTFGISKSKTTGEIKRVPQINTKEDGVCESVKALYEQVPELVELDGYFILRHRAGLLKGFLRDADENGFLIAGVIGLTNTLRFQHTTIVNLPQIPKPYWEEIRGCLIAPDDEHILCGSDMSGLEDSTKRHYMFYYDPEYVKEMMAKDFDPHLDIAVLANLLTKQEADGHKLYEQTKKLNEKDPTQPIRGVSQKVVRLKAKKVNFAGVYGAGPPKIAETANIPLPEAKALHTTYWKRNWAVKQIAKDCIVKTVRGQMWLFNPISQLWLTLRHEKDRFSTLNQSTGVYCFDTWVRFVRQQGIRTCGQFHDEIIALIRKEERDSCAEKLKLAIDKTNDTLKLNVKLGISIDFGHRYSDIH